MGNGDVEERKKSCSEIFYLHSGIFIYANRLVYLYQQAGSFLLEDINLIYLQQNNCGYS
jgi:hypothetical protein